MQFLFQLISPVVQSTEEIKPANRSRSAAEALNLIASHQLLQEAREASRGPISEYQVAANPSKINNKRSEMQQ
jgi:hypothetical protein